MEGYDRALKRITKRLGRSRGRIARRNAHRELDMFLRIVRRELRRKFPAIGKDGKAITEQTLPVGQRRCPADGAYVRTASDFAAHVVRLHGGKCWCGFQPQRRISGEFKLPPGSQTEFLPVKIVSSLRAHFNRFKEQLSAHVSIGALGAEQEGD